MRRWLLRWVSCWLILATAGLNTAAIAAGGHCGGKNLLEGLAQTDPAALASIRAEAAALENTQALFWKIEKSGVAPSYLYGTMHVSDARITTLKPPVEKAITSAQAVVLEVADLTSSALAAAMSETSGAELIYSDGRTLSAQLTAPEFKKVEEVVKNTGLPAAAAKVMRPWLVSTLLSMSACERQQAALGAQVLDMQISKRAKDAGIPVAGLETIGQQLQALASIPEGEQLSMLRVGLQYYEQTDDMMETMLQLYLNRDMGAAMPFQKALAARMGIETSAFDGFQQSLLIDRNKRMSANARQHLDKGGAFIAVGALHLPGKTGLVTLLREAGYTVTPAE